MTTRRRLSLFALPTAMLLVLGVLAALAVWALDSAAPSPSDERSARADEVAAAWVEGSVLRYAVQQRSEVRLVAGDPAERTTQDIRVDLRGELCLEVLECAAEGVHLQLRLDAAEVSAGAQREAGWNQALGRPFHCLLSPIGEFRRFDFPAGMEDSVAEQLRSLVESLQMIVPASAGTRWVRQERDGTGEFEADYRRGATAEGEELIKSKRRYVRLESGPAQVGDLRLLRSRSRSLRTPDTPWHRSLELEEESELVRDGQVLVHARLSVRLALRTSAEGTPRPSQWPSLAPSLAASLDPTVQEAMDEEVGVELWRPEWERLWASILEGRAIGPARAELRALLLRCPEAAAALASDEVLQAGGERERFVLFEALSAAGHPEAQRVLLQIVRSPALGTQSLLQALAAVGGLQRPEAETVDALLALEQQLGADGPLPASTALLGLGRLAALDSVDPAARARARARLQDRLRGATDVRGQVASLTAIRNAGDPALTQQATAFLASDELRVRLAAARTLLAQPDAGTPARMAQALHDEPTSHGRIELIEAYSHSTAHGGAFVGALQRLALDEPDPQVRRRIAHLLAQRAQEHPELQAELRAWVAREEDDQTRLELHRALRGERPSTRRPNS